MSDRPRVPPYFDLMIEAFHRGDFAGRSVHLGHWDEPAAATAPLDPGEFARAQQRLDEIVLSLAGLAPGQRVLDVGCGFGGTLERIDTLLANADLVGLNVDRRQLEICQRLEPRRDNRLWWIVADGCRLPFDGAAFDRVLSVEAMFHFGSRRRFFAEASRVLRPGGRLIATDILLSRPPAPVAAPPGCDEAALLAGYGPWPDPWGRDADLRELGRSAGLRCVHWRDASAETRPSHRFTVPPGTDRGQPPSDPGLRAALTLKWLHDSGHLAYVYAAFDKPPSP